MTHERTLKGWHVLAILIAFFGGVMAVNVYFATVAVRTFPGQEEAKPYMQGLHYNKELARREAERSLGWTVSVESADVDDGRVRIILSMKDKAGAALDGLSVNAELRRPSHAGEDAALAFEPRGGGLYAGDAAAAPGVWDLAGEARDAAGQTIDVRARLVLK